MQLTKEKAAELVRECEATVIAAQARLALARDLAAFVEKPEDAPASEEDHA